MKKNLLSFHWREVQECERPQSKVTVINHEMAVVGYNIWKNIFNNVKQLKWTPPTLPYSSHSSSLVPIVRWSLRWHWMQFLMAINVRHIWEPTTAQREDAKLSYNNNNEAPWHCSAPANLKETLESRITNYSSATVNSIEKVGPTYHFATTTDNGF